MTRKFIRDANGQFAGYIGDGKTPPESQPLDRSISSVVEEYAPDEIMDGDFAWDAYQFLLQQKKVLEAIQRVKVDSFDVVETQHDVHVAQGTLGSVAKAIEEDPKVEQAKQLLIDLRSTGQSAVYGDFYDGEEVQLGVDGKESGEWTGLPDFELTISDFRRFVDHPRYRKQTDILDSDGEKVGEMTAEVSDITGDAATLIRLAFGEKDYRDNRASLRVETKETRDGYLHESEVSFQLMYHQHNEKWTGASEKECFASLYDWLRIKHLQ